MQRKVHQSGLVGIIFVILIQTPFSSVVARANDTLSVNFCVPNADVYPFFIYQDATLTGTNPDIMKRVFQQETLSNVNLEFVPRPWKRCDIELKAGTVDMIVGSYRESRDSVGIYPKEIGAPYDKAVFSTVEVCLTTLNNTAHIEKVRAGLNGEDKLTVGVEAGFSQQHKENVVFEWLVLYNYLEKFRLLEKGRVDAIAQVCSIDNTPIKTKAEDAGLQNIITLYPPYLSSEGYVIFSEQFMAQHADIAKTILDELGRIDKQAIFQNYRPSQPSQE
ncbi:substrate-binding periplasmic protein [Alteromonas facilis]|uniref:substrate-binding periplasmic protein n=1 Tax=Alteromonas facilis TaxID=2048004 RepID=UPI000C28EB0F|nr:transporter substrate-binding domain-containing protein [Alteromonas facilis]